MASSIGLDLLRQGANAADVAVAVAAALAVTEPCSTGLGGDMFCLYYSAATQKVSAINGSGKSPAALTHDMLCQAYGQGGSVDAEAFRLSPHAVTVPGAAQGWEDTVQRFGSKKFTLAQLLEPAAQLAEEGFPVAPVTSHYWKSGLDCISQWVADKTTQPIPLTVDGKRAPKPGEIMHNPDMARVLRDLGKFGAKEGFYQGATGRAIAARVQELGGCLTDSDLASHSSLFPDPIGVDYRGHRLWQVPPNGQGLAGLVALSGIAHLEQNKHVPAIESMDDKDRLHLMIEMMRLGFADGRAYIADPDACPRTTDDLLNPKRIGERASRLFDATKANIAGAPDASSCTVSFQVVDKEGNAMSFVNSNFMGFGTGIVPKGCGFSMQNRGFGFNLSPPEHPNMVAPSKRPYHTIIPGMITHTDTGELYATISNMGGNMQPQGHMQLTINLLARGMDPQAAIDEPRFCIADATQDGSVDIEEGVDDNTVMALQKMGHDVTGNKKGHERSVFGRAQIIVRNRKNGVLWAGSDGRADGCAMGY